MNFISSLFLESHSYITGLIKCYPFQSVGIATICISFYTLFFDSKDKNDDGFDKIPMPNRKYPYLGHLPYFRNNAFLKLYEWHKELGPIIHVKMGNKDFVFISDPVIAYKVFNVNGSITSLRPPNKFIDEYLFMNGRGLVFSNSEKKMKELRSSVTSYLTNKRVDQMHDIFRLETNNLTDLLMTHGSTKGVNPFPYINLRSFNVMTRICFGTRFDSVDSPDFLECLEINHLSTKYAGLESNCNTYIPALGFMEYIQTKNKTKIDFANNIYRPFFRRTVNQALEGGQVCLITKIKELNKDSLYDEDDLLMMSSDLLIAGTHTISLTIVWAFALLSHHPEVQRKICAEIDTFIAKHRRLPKFSEREEFPYMTSVQREAIRLYSTTPFGVPHMAEQDFVVNNYTIKKGTTLISDMYSIHRNPDIYPDPHKFIPERFINNTSTISASANGKPTERDQYNFGWGRRMCPGIYLAETEMFFAYTTLWARCTIEPALDSNNNPVYADIESIIDNGVVTMPKPYKVRFVERPDKLVYES
ncbi:cytochrome P450 [Spinellus fusiger]|nr:cytochrome P450 [Spinellus fusiger]